ncbi:hypothetical protein J6590_100104 [Homalodisca vitripennis]|nr:hypothetical protein J6590_100104 [Homalodisca vitripennis]
MRFVGEKQKQQTALSKSALTQFVETLSLWNISVREDRGQCQVNVESSSINKNSNSATFLGSNPGRTAINPTSFVSKY